MNHYVFARLADLRLEQTAREARAAWWRTQRSASENDRAARPSLLLHWSIPVSARITGV